MSGLEVSGVSLSFGGNRGAERRVHVGARRRHDRSHRSQRRGQDDTVQRGERLARPAVRAGHDRRARRHQGGPPAIGPAGVSPAPTSGSSCSPRSPSATTSESPARSATPGGAGAGSTSAPRPTARSSWSASRDVADREVSELPTARARVVEVARALMTQPKVLLLDEPASGQTEQETEVFGRLLRQLVDERGLAICLVEHDVNLVMGDLRADPRARLRRDHRQRDARTGQERSGGGERLPGGAVRPATGRRAHPRAPRHPGRLRTDRGGARGEPRGPRRFGGRPARPQRRRQDDDAQRLRRDARPEQRRGVVSPANTVNGRLGRRPGATGHVHRARRSRDLPEPHRAREPPDGDAGRRADGPRSRTWPSPSSPAGPNRRKQLAGTLSGGEQQMLALARAFATTRSSSSSTSSRSAWPRSSSSELYEKVRELASGGPVDPPGGAVRPHGAAHRRHRSGRAPGRHRPRGLAAEMEEALSESYLGG